MINLSINSLLQNSCQLFQNIQNLVLRTWEGLFHSLCRVLIAGEEGEICRAEAHRGQRGVKGVIELFSGLEGTSKIGVQTHVMGKVANHCIWHWMRNIYKRIVFLCSAQDGWNETQTCLGNMKQPKSPYLACLFCVFKHHLKDVILIRTTLQCEELTILKKRVFILKRQDKQYKE